MKQYVVVLLTLVLGCSGIVVAESDAASEGVLELGMLMQFANEAGLSDYDLMDIMSGYREYRSLMDSYLERRDEKVDALTAAINKEESNSVIAGLTRELMEVDLNIVRLQQASVNEAADLMDAASVAKLYLMVRDMDAAKEAFLKQLSGEPELTPCIEVIMPDQAQQAAAPAVEEEAPAEEEAPVEDVEAVIMDSATAFLQKIADKDIDGALNAVSEDFEHYEYGSKEELKSFLDEAKLSGFLDDVKVVTDDTEITLDDEEAVLYPVDIEGFFGSITLEVTCKKEGDNWMITSMDGFGI